jgi:serine/threonine-protein kinase
VTDALRDQLQRSLGSVYTIERELGGGGMSRVFLAEETALGRRVVVKVLAPELAEGVSAERFAREIRLTATLQEPHIVPVLSTGITADGLPFYTMPYVAGDSLRARLGHGTVPLAEAVGILRDVARALAYAHARGVVHRDIKPENVLLSAGTAVVTDFGIAKAITLSTAADGARATLTGLGVSVGTPAYMSPEQATGGAVEHATDIYAWGVLAYELLAGRHPFAGRANVQQLIAAHVTEPPGAEPLRRANVPGALVSLVLRCLEKDPARRPAGAGELLQALNDVAPSGRGGTLGAGLRGVRPVAALVVVVLLAAGVWGATRRDAPRDAAVRAERAGTRSLAVLPFENLGGDTADAYLAQGLADALAVTLAKLPGITVAPGASTRALLAQKLTAQEIARRLGVEGVLTGRVRRSGDRLRVVAELSDAAGGPSWSDQFDESRADLFAIEDRLTRAIAGALQPRLTGAAATPGADSAAPPRPERGTTDPEAYDLYMRGRYFWSTRTADGHRTAFAYYRQAIARDSTYAAPHAALADAYLTEFMHGYTRLPEAQSYARHRAEAERALALDEASADARVTYAVSLWWQRDWLGAERQLRRALEMNPGDARAHDWYSLLLAGMNRLEEARAESQRANALDPFAPNFADDLAWHLFLARDYAGAVAQSEKVLEIHRSYYPNAHRTLALALSAQGRHADAIGAIRQAITLAPTRQEYQGDLAYLLARSGARQEARAVLREAIGRRAESFNVARAWIALGEADSAFVWLERSSWHWPNRAVRADPALDAVRSDPRFARLSQRIEAELLRR